MYEIEIPEKLDKKFFKLARKNPTQIIVLQKKLTEICENPYRYKRLKGDLKGAFRVHIDTHFVLVYEVDSDMQIVRLLEFEHHDKVYD
ncbi:type II toxin-antitoxin system mRNA interferase toxin, RelE/StbE family [Candidatus Woesearchaeota archaeon]|nr:type II toxin-antitoxin system mRNA interferase toxin, RelE/StbE family [Candidatus Woesearchaeota archaeon]